MLFYYSKRATRAVNVATRDCKLFISASKVATRLVVAFLLAKSVNLAYISFNLGSVAAVISNTLTVSNLKPLLISNGVSWI